jgi:NADP-dependent 3-hydroxy acid dehydrogenase YdfG
LRLAEQGYRVLALGRDQVRLDELAVVDGIETRRIDVTDRVALAALAADAQIDVLINNAGFMPALSLLHSADQDEIDAAIAVNFTAQVALTRLVVPGMVARKKGHVVFTGSTAGHAPVSGMAVYCATKSAISGLAQALRLELSAHGVRVTEIVAGRVETNLYRGVITDAERAAMYAGPGVLQPDDVAAMVSSVLALPGNANVARFDIMPTWPTAAVNKKN